MRTKKRKGVFEGLSNAALSMVILVIIVSIGVLILAEFNATTSTPAANTVIGQGLDALGTFGDFFDLIVVAIIGIALFILILAGLARFRGGGDSSF
jgi:hypothetical protein